MKQMNKLLFVPLLITIGAISTHTMLLVYLLFGSTILDFITGIIASYTEDKKSKKTYKAYFIQSGRMRESVVKAIAYMFLIITTHVFVTVFSIPLITIPIVGIITSLTTLAFTICISIEVYSVFENLKRSGFDIFAKLGKVITGITKGIKYCVKAKDAISKEL